MGDSSSYLHKILFALIVLVTFFSCSQVSPQLNYSAGSVVFDFENETDFPNSRMSVFVDLNSDAHRAESIKIESISAGYIWEVNNLLNIENGKRQYAGFTNCVMPADEYFPQGKYKLTFWDANDEKVENFFELRYADDLYNLTAKDAASFCNSNDGSEYWAAYDNLDVLIFFQQKEDGAFDVDFVWKCVSEAKSARTVWISSGSRTICLMPKIYNNKED